VGASRFVGRVGGLAMALGVGAAVFTGVGVAWADDSPSSNAGPKATSQHAAGGSSASQNGSRAKKAKVSAGSNSSSSEGNSAQATKVDNTVRANTFTGVAPSATASKGSTTQSVTLVSQPVTTALVDPTSGGNAPLPVDSPVALALAAFVRKEASSAASTTNPAASVTTSANLSASSAITVNPTVTWTNGVLMGSVNAVCASCGSPLTYTVISGPNAGGKVNLNLGAFGTDPLLAGNFSYLPYATTLATTGATEQFKIRVNSTTGVVTFLEGIPLLGMVVTPVVNILYGVPVLNTLLAPIIGYSTIASFDVDPNSKAAGKAATAFTDKVTSFDGTKISVNFFPSIDVANGVATEANTILWGPGLATAGDTNPLGQVINGTVPGLQTLRTTAGPFAGFNVLTWDPRGEFASGGALQLDNPQFEGRDVSSIISWLSTPDTVGAGVGNLAFAQVTTGADFDGYTDPAVVGMVGLSYGGGIQNVSAAIDPRIKTIVPAWSWNTLNSSLYPDGAFKTAYGSLLLLSLITSGARINPVIYQAVLLGDLLGVLTESQQAVISSSGPGALENIINVPALFLQGTDDVLFPLQQAVMNAAILAAKGLNTKMVWTCIGHGECLNPGSLAQQAGVNVQSTMAYLYQYVNGDGPLTSTLPTFTWFDQTNQGYSAPYLPSDPLFNSGTITEFGDGGRLFIVPVLGGSNPPSQGTLPYSLGEGSPARNAVSVFVDVPVGDKIAGAPTVSFDYSGIGTSRFLFGQVVDTSTGLVLGTLVTPIPVTLNGKAQTASISLANIAWTSTPTDHELEIQLTTSASAFWNFTSFGTINISNPTVTLPIVDNSIVTTLPAPPV
jgi:ABC-2 type transport system ATP-binding protein